MRNRVQVKSTPSSSSTSSSEPDPAAPLKRTPILNRAHLISQLRQHHHHLIPSLSNSLQNLTASLTKQTHEFLFIKEKQQRNNEEYHQWNDKLIQQRQVHEQEKSIYQQRIKTRLVEQDNELNELQSSQQQHENADLEEKKKRNQELKEEIMELEKRVQEEKRKQVARVRRWKMEKGDKMKEFVNSLQQQAISTSLELESYYKQQSAQLYQLYYDDIKSYSSSSASSTLPILHSDIIESSTSASHFQISKSSRQEILLYLQKYVKEEIEKIEVQKKKLKKEGEKYEKRKKRLKGLNEEEMKLVSGWNKLQHDSTSELQHVNATALVMVDRIERLYKAMNEMDYKMVKQSQEKEQTHTEFMMLIERLDGERKEMEHKFQDFLVNLPPELFTLHDLNPPASSSSSSSSSSSVPFRDLLFHQQLQHQLSASSAHAAESELSSLRLPSLLEEWIPIQDWDRLRKNIEMQIRKEKQRRELRGQNEKREERSKKR